MLRGQGLVISKTHHQCATYLLFSLNICSPNTVIGINGFVVTPELLEEAPAPAAEAADEDATRDLPPTTPDTPPEEDSATGTFRNLLAASAAGAAVLAAMVM